MGAIERSDFPINEKSANEPELLKPIVSVERSDKTIENDWILEEVVGDLALVTKTEEGTGKTLRKHIPVAKLEELNPELDLRKKE